VNGELPTAYRLPLHMTRVKICGITGPDDARLAAELGAAALGFNFYPPSPRYVLPSAAATIIRQLPPLVMAVGVFADETEAGHVANVARDARVNTVQLHGPRFPIVSGALQDYPVIRVVTIREPRDLEKLPGTTASAFLLDNFDPKLIGGTGKTIDWALAREARRYGHVILAGGLTPANVAQAIREVRPYAVDVASGVESAPGKKDPQKLRAFFAAVEEADRQH
jgi:phosphoribosylanthranilate isomerase